VVQNFRKALKIGFISPRAFFKSTQIKRDESDDQSFSKIGVCKT